MLLKVNLQTYFIQWHLDFSLSRVLIIDSSTGLMQDLGHFYMQYLNFLFRVFDLAKLVGQYVSCQIVLMLIAIRSVQLCV